MNTTGAMQDVRGNAGQRQRGRGLLEDLYRRVGCLYLSDLMLTENLRAIQTSLREIDPASYCLEEWRNAISFITGRECSFNDSGEARYYLMGCAPRENEEEKAHCASTQERWAAKWRRRTE
jgi:predicted metal-dependent hydrolase